MAVIGYISNGMPSALNAALELARRLGEVGHETIFLSPVDIGVEVEAAGFAFELLDADQRFKRLYEDASSREERARIRSDSLENRQIEEKITELGADLLFIDIEMNFAIIATARLELPTILPIAWFSIDRSWRNPPLHSTQMPPRSAIERLRVISKWMRLWIGSALHQFVKDARSRATREPPPPITFETRSLADLRDLARHRGWDLRRHTSRTHWLRPVMYTDLDLLCFNLEELDFPSAGGERTHYVGPMVDLDRKETRVSAEDRRRLDAFLADGRRTSVRPLVYCSLGSFWATDRQLLGHIIDVFRKRDDWDLVIGLGGRLALAELGHLPNNVLALEWAPQIELISAANCVVTHAGIMTINECVASGVPMVLYSTGHVDQDGSAARVAYHGLGIMGDRAKDSPREIEAKIGEVLDDPRYQSRVEEMKELMVTYAQSRQAERVVQAILENRQELGHPGGS